MTLFLESYRRQSVFNSTFSCLQDQPQELAQLSCTIVEWKNGTQPLQGVVFAAEGTAPSSPLLVYAHGGPAGGIVASRVSAASNAHLLFAGFRIFSPAFRGSTGFGDAFTAANIDCQGVDDLADILTGVQALEHSGVVSMGVPCGIYGGSYGGYMSFAGLSFSDRFSAGIPQFGFIDNRQMSLITGDYTYEEEYFSSTEAMAKSDIDLAQINAPTLLMHGCANQYLSTGNVSSHFHIQ